jgi:hypothetical protein
LGHFGRADVPRIHGPTDGANVQPVDIEAVDDELVHRRAVLPHEGAIRVVA